MSSFKRKDIVLRPRASFGVLSHHIENRVDAEKSHVKTMLVPFWIVEAFHKEHLPEETTNAAKYIVMLIRFAKRLKRGTIPVRATRFGVFLFKTTLGRHIFWRMRGVCVQIDHPPYSPDLDPAAFFPFPRLEPASKRKEIRRNSRRPTKRDSVPKEDFSQSFQALVMGGDYFEGRSFNCRIEITTHRLL